MMKVFTDSVQFIIVTKIGAFQLSTAILKEAKDEVSSMLVVFY